MRRTVSLTALAAALLAAACAREPAGCRGEYCGTLVIAAGAEPDALLPPLTTSTGARDVYDQIFIKLADVGVSLNTFGDSGFVPLLAERWRFTDPLTLVLSLDPRARWQDSRPVRARDVVFSFDATTDPRVNSPYASLLTNIRSITARDSLTVVVSFRRPSSELFYEAVHNLRILPEHLLGRVPRAQWSTAEFARAPVGNGPYRFVSWKPGESLELEADSTFFLGRPRIRRVIWRFAPEPTTQLAQVRAAEADAIEVVVNPADARELAQRPHIRMYPRPGATYVFLGFNFRDPEQPTRSHPLFRELELRRALTLATDRERLAEAVWGDRGVVPKGPIARMMWINYWTPTQIAYDTVEANRRLTSLGWVDRDRDGIRERDGRRLTFRVILPITSTPRRRYAQLLQEQFRLVGVDLQIEELDFGAYVTRARTGKFDALLHSWAQDPTPSSYPQVWGRAGVGALNYQNYVNPQFDAKVAEAVAAPNRTRAGGLWQDALTLINGDAPAIWLYAPSPPSAIHRRVSNVVLRPDSWLAHLWEWRIPPDQLIARDRVER